MEQLFYTINTKIIIFSDSMRTSEPTLGSEWYYVKMQKSMDTLMVSELVKILSRIRALAGDEFTGAGVIVCQLDAELPTAPLRLGISIPQEEDVATYLAKISKATNDLHDGFHVLAPDLSLISLSQYFSPPLSKTAIINRSRKFGGRYMAALFGSTISGVLLSGIATKSLGIILFKDGREIFFERT